MIKKFIQRAIFLPLVFGITLTISAESKGQSVAKNSGASREGKFGIDYSYSGSLSHWGVWYHIADRVALAPRFGFSIGEGKSDFQLGILVPFYLATFKRLDLFMAPFVGFGNKSQEVKTPDPVGGGTITSTVKSSGFELSVNLGTQLPIAEELHIFGMAGLGLNSSSTKNGAEKSTTTISTSRTALGVIFYFN